ncbi:hypothetical protein SAMN02745146_3553 [Hymenobacter daecheongensis DSM 21074]|uniref:DUF6799 domain-containing protein n=1 Tax=Hymenobacter daecheongensis DSM 21074 TaxID=1121955 RepID=A0A1M6KT00_9BACT|nr:DUF6799 domain-containing protein [Hymenobacter daecheongensis]SHJ62004.1 hypothetical protein SAMN02745146_3553 [Hymenobacter daecheongensis DSM 21074]
MKRILLPLLLLLLAATASRAQTPAAPAPAAAAAQMKDGRMLALKNGQLTPLTADLTLANGATVSPAGVMRLPTGQTMPLREGEQVTTSGMVVPAPMPTARRMSRANKHVTKGMMKPMP